MEWLEVTVNAPHGEIDGLTEQLEDLGVEGIITEDEEDIERFLEENKKYWDYVDEDFAKSIKGVSRVKFYFEDSADGKSELEKVRRAIAPRSLTVARVRDEDWENNWKEYYKPIEAGRLLVVPQWETAPDTDKKILWLDPGLIFGTGAHATTRLCLEALSAMEIEGKTVLDLGCGSGILAIAALVLGAENAVGVDIDEKAPPIVMENAALNGIGGEKLSVFAGDVLADSEFARRIADRKFNIVLANIVADVIIALAPKVGQFMAEDAVFISSGIIEGREDEVREALKKAGFAILRREVRDNWNSFICKKRAE